MYYITFEQFSSFRASISQVSIRVISRIGNSIVSVKGLDPLKGRIAMAVTAEIIRLGTLTMESHYQCNIANIQQTVLSSFNPVFFTIANGDFPK